MFNTDYNSVTNNMQILDAVGEFHIFAQVQHLVRPLSAAERPRQPLRPVLLERVGGISPTASRTATPSSIKAATTARCIGATSKRASPRSKSRWAHSTALPPDGNTSLIWASRVQIDFWDPENGYYLNGTYYGDKNLLAIAGANQVQAGKTATTVDFLMERKVPSGGAFTIESEYSRYNGLGGYDANYAKSEGAYGLASFLIPKEVGIGKVRGPRQVRHRGVHRRS